MLISFVVIRGNKIFRGSRNNVNKMELYFHSELLMLPLTSLHVYTVNLSKKSVQFLSNTAFFPFGIRKGFFFFFNLKLVARSKNKEVVV